MKQVDVADVNGSTIIAGLDTATSFGSPCWVQFRLECTNGHNAGPMMAGLAQEFIQWKTFYPGPGQAAVSLGSDADWSPGGFDANFNMSGGVIFDRKMTNNPAAGTVWPDGFVFFTRTQLLKIVWTDPFGVVHYSYCGNYNFGSYVYSWINGQWAVGAD